MEVTRNDVTLYSARGKGAMQKKALELLLASLEVYSAMRGGKKEEKCSSTESFCTLDLSRACIYARAPQQQRRRFFFYFRERNVRQNESVELEEAFERGCATRMYSGGGERGSVGVLNYFLRERCARLQLFSYIFGGEVWRGVGLKVN